MVRNREQCQGALALHPAPSPVVGYLGLQRERAGAGQGLRAQSQGLGTKTSDWEPRAGLFFRHPSICIFSDMDH